MKVCFLSAFSPSTNIGGVETHIKYLTRYLKSLGVDIEIIHPVLTINALDIDENICCDGEIYFKVKLPKFFNHVYKFSGGGKVGMFIAFFFKLIFLYKSKSLAREILKRKYDIVHQHDFSSNVITTKILSKFGVPCVLTNHTGEYLIFRNNFLLKLFLRWLLSHYSFIIGPSNELTPSQYHENVSYIPNGVDLSEFYPLNEHDKERLKKDLGFEKKFIVFCPRRWAPTKGVYYLIESIKKYEYSDNILFLFAGNEYKNYPKYVKKLHLMINSMDMTKRSKIVLLGNIHHSKIKLYYDISDVVIIPSLMEAVSISALEAMACGIPVIATKVGGMKDLITHKENGILIPPASPEDIYLSIELLYRDKFLYNHIKKTSLQTVKAYSWENIANQVYNIYISLLERNK